MSNFDNFDIHQMSPKLAQRWHFACIFYCKKIFVLGSLDYAKIVKRHLFFGHPISRKSVRLLRVTVRSYHRLAPSHTAHTHARTYKRAQSQTHTQEHTQAHTHAYKHARRERKRTSMRTHAHFHTLRYMPFS